MAPAARAADLPPIPDKLLFKIGEVSRLVGVKPHVLRYWETEFAQVRPTKTGTGHRVYSRSDVERLRQIRTLLHERRFTIAGVRVLLARGGEAVEAALTLRPAEAVQERGALEQRLDALEDELAAARREVDRLRRAVADAQAEARFWRLEARMVRETSTERLDRLRAQLDELKNFADARIEG